MALATVPVYWFCSLALASDYGTTGLIDIPTARMKSDGTLTATTAFDGRHRQYALSYQIAPQIEGTFRYTGFLADESWDRNYEVKAMLWSEGLYLPAVAVGIRDVVGTGVFGSEYLVASKGLGQLDVTMGVGWGRLAGKGIVGNPLKRIADRFETRSSETGVGGDVSFGDFFSGSEVGLFGGLRYSLTDLPVDFIAEYNPDEYEFNVGRGGVQPSNHLSVGITWRGLPGSTFTLSHQNGDEVGIAAEFSLNSLSDPRRRSRKGFISSYYLSQSALPPQIRKERWYSRLLYDVERSGLLLVEGTLSEDQQQAQLVVGNASLALWSDAIADLTLY